MRGNLHFGSDLNAILSMLVDPENKTQFISGQHLAMKLGVSRVAIWKRIRTLRRLGYSISAKPALGYRLEKSTTLPLPWELDRVLRTKFLGRGANLIYKHTINSTQTLASKLASKIENSNGLVVIAEQQSKGRGRHNRRWESPPGGIYISIVLKLQIASGKITLLPFATGLAIKDAIKKITGLSVELKWPNDILLSGSKVAGILLDVTTEGTDLSRVIIGIGINANVDLMHIRSSVKERKSNGLTSVTSLSHEIGGQQLSRLQLVAQVLEEIERYLLQLAEYTVEQAADHILQRWRKSSCTLGRDITVKVIGAKAFAAKALDVAPDGSLIVVSENGEFKKIVSDEVSIN